MELRTFVVAELLEASELCLSRKRPEPALAESIHRWGLFKPPFVLSIEGPGPRFLVADGQRRLSVLQEEGESHCQCLVQKAESAAAAFELAWTRRFFDDEASAVQKALAQTILDEYNIKEVPATIQQALRLSRKESSRRLLAIIAGLPEDIHFYLESIQAGEKHLRQLPRLGEANFRELMTTRAIPLHLNANQLRRAMTMSADILLAGQFTLTDILALPEGKQALTNTEEFFGHLYRLRYPDFSRHEAQFRETVRRIPEHYWQCEHHNFEGERLGFHLEAASPEEVRNAARCLDEAGAAGELDSLFEFLWP